MRRSVSATLVAALAAILVWGGAAPASADAASGVCDAGRRLESFTYYIPAYDSFGQEMFRITTTKRWCYNLDAKAVASSYDPKPVVTISSGYFGAWKVGSIVKTADYFTSVGANGYNHPNYPKWGHVGGYLVNMEHCFAATGWCDNTPYYVGVTGYWDGSKKLTYS